MKNHHPVSFAAQILSRLSTMLRAVRRAQVMAVALAGVWLLLAPGHSVWAITDYINNPDVGESLEGVGKLIEFNEKIKRAARAIFEIEETRLDRLLEFTFDLESRQFSKVVLQPANNPNAGGGGTNISSDGNCVVGYQDSGFLRSFMPFAGRSRPGRLIWEHSTRRTMPAAVRLRPTRTKIVPSSSVCRMSRPTAPSNMPSAGPPAAWSISARRRTVALTPVLWA